MATQRPALDEMLVLLREGDTVVVGSFRFNRLANSRKYLIDLVGEFADCNYVFKALALRIDNPRVAEKLTLYFFALAAARTISAARRDRTSEK